MIAFCSGEKLFLKKFAKLQQVNYLKGSTRMQTKAAYTTRGTTWTNQSGSSSQLSDL